MDGKIESIENLDHFQNEYTIVQENIHRTSSTVWRYFGSLKKNDEIIDTSHVYCSQCFDQRKTKKYQRSTSTGNLLKHLKKAHEIIVDQPLFRVKRERDGNLSMAKTEYIDASQLMLQHSSQGDDSDSEYLVEGMYTYINEVLIMEIQKRPQIYDSSLCPKNKNQIRRELWMEIYQVMNQLIPLEKLPKIWKNIRDRYHKIKKDIDGSDKKPKYRYFELLRFLDNHCSRTIKKEKGEFGSTERFITETFDDDDDEHLDPHMDMSEYVQVKPRNEFVNTMKEIKIESFSNNEQQTIEPPMKKRKLSETEIDETEQHLEEDDDQFGQQIVESFIEEIGDDVTNDPLTDTKLQLSSIAGDENNDYVDNDYNTIDDNVVEENDQPIMHLLETSESTMSTTLPTPSSSMLTTVSTLPKIQIKSRNTNQQQQQQLLVKNQNKKVLSSSKYHIITTDDIFGNNNNATPTTTTVSATATTSPPATKSNEFDIFGDFVGQVMKEMPKSRARLLQMKILQLISDYDG